MATNPDHDDDRIRFTPVHEQDLDGLGAIPYDDLQPDFEVAGEAFIESFFE